MTSRQPRADRRPPTGRRSSTINKRHKINKKRGYKPPLRVPLGSSPRRLRVVLVILAVGLSLCAGRLLQLQGFDSSAYAAISTKQLTRTLPLLPSRGEITDRNGAVLASTEPAVAVTADPTYTSENAAQIAAILAPYLNKNPAELIKILTTPNTRFVYVAKKVPAATYTQIADKLADADLYGIFRESDPIRTYPGGSVGASVIGFVGADGKGLGGLEYSLNTQLAGVEGKEVYESAPNGSRIPLGNSITTPATNGTNYQLTIDSDLQWVSDQRLAAQVRTSKAESGLAITMDVKTGEILALSNYPTFDSAKPGAAKADDRGNRAVTDAYEPGSVEKVLTSAALIDSGVANPDTRVEVPSRIFSGSAYIKDHYSHGTIDLTMRGIVANSSNIGMVLLSRQSDKATLHSYLTSFGLGRPTGLGLPGEASGILPSADMKDYTRDQIAFGQGLSVTGVQMAAAVSGIVNGGIYHPPTLIKSATDGNGAPVAIDRPDSHRVVSEKTSAEVRDMMSAVVTHGGKSLKVPGYLTGGKTGTAERVDPACGCYRGYTASYVGFAPLDDPQILTYVVIQNPKVGDSGTQNAAPAYSDIMEYALPRYGIPPSTKKAPTRALTW